ncbi:MAG: DUF433 domain-containing protein [Actinomycetia bacterium]|nr:DUF433 domain-containing protein [Actinomycetes bacterium]
MTATATEAAVDKFTSPLYSPSEAARFLGLPESTFRNWAHGYRVEIDGRVITGDTVLRTVERKGRQGPNIPFAGLAEGYALAAIRRSGVPMQRIRPALDLLSREMGIAHALASERLFTDGAEVLFDYSETVGEEERAAVRDLVAVRSGQRVLNEVVAGYLKRIEFGSDGFASAVPLPGFERAQIVADVRRSFGQPVFRRGGVRLEDAIALFKAERDIDVVSEEYGIPRAELEDVLATLVKS